MRYAQADERDPFLSESEFQPGVRSVNLPRFVLAAFLALATSSASMGGILVAIDVGKGPVQADFSQFAPGADEEGGLGAISHVYGAIRITIDGLNQPWRARDRGGPDNLLGDFMTSSDGDSIVATIAGLAPGITYALQLWSFEYLSDQAFLTDWTANGVMVKQNYAQNQGPAAPYSAYTFSFNSVADASGQIEVIGLGHGGPILDGARINGLQISTVDQAVPEPSTLLISSILLAAFGTSRFRRRTK